MYIADKYWNNYIGDSDDSLTLASYLMYKRQEKISLAEIFADFGLDKLNGNFRQNDEPITVRLKDNENNEYDVEFYYPIDIITDLAAILLECKKSGSVDINELLGDDLKPVIICLTSTEKEENIIKTVLEDFYTHPLEYNLSEMCPEEDMLEMAEICKDLAKELFEE